MDDVPPNQIIYMVRGQRPGSHIDQGFVACAYIRPKMMVIVAKDTIIQRCDDMMD